MNTLQSWYLQSNGFLINSEVQCLSEIMHLLNNIDLITQNLEFA